MGCFDFKIKSQPVKQFTKPNVLSQKPDLALSKEDKLTFGQLLWQAIITSASFAEILMFKIIFEDKAVRLDDTKNWFEVNILGTSDPKTFEIFWIPVPEANGELNEAIRTDKEIIACIQTLTPNNNIFLELIATTCWVYLPYRARSASSNPKTVSLV